MKPASKNPSNNVNVIQLSYVPGGMNIRYQTPFGIDGVPTIQWGTQPNAVHNTATGTTKTWDRTPPCSMVAVTQCSQFLHDIQITGLKPNTKYYYTIPASNGTTCSDVMEFTTAKEAGDSCDFTIAVLNDMGYTNAIGTHKYLKQAARDGIAFAWHGGDLSYADDWYSGILPCQSDWPVCYNGSNTALPGSPPIPIPAQYADAPLPAGEVANQGGPQGGDMSVIYESNWDLWQQWMNDITTQIPYMTLPGNHEAACAEFDGPGNILTAYLNNNKPNSTAPTSSLTYYSCPPSQRNFTTYLNRFRMPGPESGGVDNMWYSFEYGLAHFISIDTETDYYKSPEYPFVADLTGSETHPKENETYVTDSGPFGYIQGSYKNTQNYEQYQWLKKDLASIDRTKTPWVIVNGHRPMYSSQVATYQKNLRNAFEALFLEYGVDVFVAGHEHLYERLYPLGTNGTIDHSAIVNNHTYIANHGTSVTYLVNGAAGNIESHSELGPGQPLLPITAVFDTTYYGFGKLHITPEKLTWDYIHGIDGSVGDTVTVLKKQS